MPEDIPALAGSTTEIENGVAGADGECRLQIPDAASSHAVARANAGGVESSGDPGRDEAATAGYRR